MTQALTHETLLRSTAATLAERFRRVRAQTEALCAPLETEDYVIQPNGDVSPPKWHLAHTSWFFEHFILDPELPGYQRFHPMFGYLFNSYYVQAGKFHPRVNRGILSRPTVAEVYSFRSHVTERVLDLLSSASEEQMERIAPMITLGLNHEQQHQELLVTDIKYILSCNPLEPVYEQRPLESQTPTRRLHWLEFSGGLHQFGHQGDGFCFDNETPRHAVYLNDYRLADRLVTNGEYLTFIEDGGYQSAELWLSDGWSAVQDQGWTAPLYWHNLEGVWSSFTLAGTHTLDPGEPVCHVSHYEADAFARWAGKRLPTEFEWERAAESLPVEGNFVESGRLHPAQASGSATQLFGDVWEWTGSAYLPYPGFVPLAGAVGEYNGKFMSSQMVLRGGSCATPRDHARATYRNFFQPHHRWQFMGVRLAE